MLFTNTAICTTYAKVLLVNPTLGMSEVDYVASDKKWRFPNLN